MSKVFGRWVPKISVHINCINGQLCSRSAEYIHCKTQLTNCFSLFDYWGQNVDSSLGSRKWITIYAVQAHDFHAFKFKEFFHTTRGHQLLKFWQQFSGIQADCLWYAICLLERQLHVSVMQNSCCKFSDVMNQKRWGKLSLGIWLLDDNAPVHKSVIAHPALYDCGFVQLNHPVCSSYLAPSDYFLFRNMKSPLRGTWFTDAESLKITVEAWFDRQDDSIFKAQQFTRKVGRMH